MDSAFKSQQAADLLGATLQHAGAALGQFRFCDRFFQRGKERSDARLLDVACVRPKATADGNDRDAEPLSDPGHAGRRFAKDSLPDDLEQSKLHTLAYVPNDDPDQDGFTNLREYVADTDPLDGTSYLHLSSIARVPGGVRLDWQGGQQATQYLQRTFSLSGSNVIWQNILTSTPPTQLFRSYTNSTTSNAWYRVKALR